MRLSLLALSACLILNGCCTKEACPEYVPNIKLSGFTLKETENIQIVYLDNTNDTFTVEANYHKDDTSQLYMSHSVATVMDADIIIPAANRQYRISDAVYETKKSPCGKCRFRSNKVSVLTGCKVNGVSQSTDVTLTK